MISLTPKLKICSVNYCKKCKPNINNLIDIRYSLLLKIQTPRTHKADIRNYRKLGWLTGATRPTSASRQMLVNVCLLLKSGHSEAVNDRQPTASLQNSALRIILIKE